MRHRGQACEPQGQEHCQEDAYMITMAAMRMACSRAGWVYIVKVCETMITMQRTAYREQTTTVEIQEPHKTRRRELQETTVIFVQHTATASAIRASRGRTQHHTPIHKIHSDDKGTPILLPRI